MTYTELDRVAAAFADLLAERPNSQQLRHSEPAQAALVCRDAVVTELRALTREVLHLGPTAGTDRHSDLSVLIGSPAHALHTALTSLPPVTDKAMPLPAALDVTVDSDAAGASLVRAWQDAGRAATALERHLTGAADLNGADAWQVLRTVADLAAALPVLDADLAEALPADRLAQASVLHDHASHALIRVAAHELRAQTTDLPHPAQPAAATSTGPQQIAAANSALPAGGLAQLPAATEHLAALVRARGADLTALEAGATCRVLADGLTLTGRILHATTGPYEPVRDLAVRLHDAVPHLQAVAAGRLATLTPPSMQLQYAAGSIREQLRAIAGLADRLDREPDSRHHLQRLTPLLTAWACQAVGAAVAVDGALRRADADNRLLTLRTDTVRGKDERLLWLPLNGNRGQTPHPTLAAASHASHLLTAVHAPLGQLSTTTGGAQASSTAANSAAAASAAARTSATSAASELRAALRRRNPPPVGAPRTTHPASGAVKNDTTAPQHGPRH